MTNQRFPAERRQEYEDGSGLNHWKSDTFIWTACLHGD